MAGVSLNIGFEDGSLGAMLRRAAEGGRDLTVPLQHSGDVMENSIRQRFRDGRGPGGIPWPISHRAAVEGGSTLINRGSLSTGISSEVQGQSVTAGVQSGTASAKYAASQQFGVTIRPRRAEFLVFNLPGVGLVFAKEVTLPARPFVGIDSDDLEALVEVWTAFAEGLLT